MGGKRSVSHGWGMGSELTDDPRKRSQESEYDISYKISSVPFLFLFNWEGGCGGHSLSLKMILALWENPVKKSVLVVCLFVCLYVCFTYCAF